MEQPPQPSEHVKTAMKKALEEQQERDKQNEKIDFNPYRLPLTRIKKIIKSDEDVGVNFSLL